MRIIPPLGGGQWDFNPQIPEDTSLSDYYFVDGRGNCWPDLRAAQVRELAPGDCTLVGMGAVADFRSGFPEGARYQVAVWVEDLQGMEPGGVELGEAVLIRELQGKTPTQMQLYATANGLAAFHLRFKYCHRCGGSLESAESGWARHCRACGEMVYPRQDPAIIVTIFDAAGRLLLAHNTAWPARRVSLIAGFINMGESAEQAVCREISEEVGLNVKPEWVSYVTTQTWPFPQSLMLAYEVHLPADYPDLELTPDGVEIEWARWFARSEYLDAVVSGEVSGPVNHSVAAALVRAWLDNHMGTPVRI